MIPHDSVEAIITIQCPCLTAMMKIFLEANTGSLELTRYKDTNEINANGHSDTSALFCSPVIFFAISINKNKVK